MFQEIVDDLKTQQTILTATVIWTVYPELTLKEVFDRLNDPAEVVKLIEELEAVPDGSIDELRGDLI